MTGNEKEVGEETSRALEGDLQAHLGRALRQVYGDVLAAPVPDKFLLLLEQLDESAKSVPAANSDGTVAANGSPADQERRGA